MMQHTSFGVGRVVVALAVVALVSLAIAPVAAQTKIDVTGTWAFDVQTGAGAGSPTITLKQNGENLTGSYEGQLGNANLTGTLKGQAITFSFTVDVQGQTANVVYAGTAEQDAMKGTVDIGSGAVSGTFTAKRK